MRSGRTVEDTTQLKSSADDDPTTRAPKRRTFRFRPRVGIGGLILTLAMLPVLGAGWFAFHEYEQVSDSNRVALVVREDAKELVALANLSAAVLDERNWVSASSGLEVLGIPIELAEAVTGISISEADVEARAKVDELLAKGSYPAIASEIALIRSVDGATLDEMGALYSQLELQVARDCDQVLDRLLTIAGDVDNGSELLTSLRVLEASVQMRQSVAYQLSHYFSAQFSSFTTASVDTENVISQIALYDSAAAAMQRTGRLDQSVLVERTQIDLSPDQVKFRAAVDSLIADAFGGDVDENLSGITDSDITEVAATFEAGARLSRAHLSLVNTAGLAVTEASNDVNDAAGRATQSALKAIVLLGASSLLFAGLLAQFIARPLKKLARTAKHLRDGETDVRAIPTGPREVQAATAALNEAAGHLQLAERQASALAEGNLGHAALDETAPGALGASLQTAVHTLATSLGEREDFRRRLAHETTHDALTGLPNRNSCLAQLQRSLARADRTASSVAVLVVDIDNFNEVNDRLGHPAGDRVLRAIARRLVSTVREGDQVGRLGGDEFLVIAEPVAGAKEALQLGERLAEAVTNALRVEGTDLHVQATIGVAITDSGCLTADEMLRDADLAVHKAKSGGPGRVELCDESLRAEILRLADLEQALRHAIATDELTLFYQPIVASITGEVTGFEALVRWDRPGQGLASPAEFIPVAERSDLIVELDRWVLNAAAQQLRDWSGTSDFATTSVSVNVSGRHLGSEHFLTNVMNPLERFDVNPERLIVEITESALLDDLGEAATKLQELRERDIRIAIDDFGTGYTSLAHLKTLPIDILKIDRSFTNDPGSLSLVQLIVDTGHLLGASITAEGIETKEQADALTDAGSDSLQGYYFARPAPPSQVALDAGRRVTATHGA